MVKAARIDSQGVYQGMDDLEEDELTPLHLPQITSCDLTPLKYRWIVEADNPFGGHFDPITEEQKNAPAPDAMNAIALGLLALFQGQPCPGETKAWLTSHFNSFDFKGF